MKKSIYIFSGLGADERAFIGFEFVDYEVFFIKWIVPTENESIEDYTLRLSNQIIAKRPILIGLSFGGLVAIEMAKQIEVEKVILIASAKTKLEIPFYFRWVGVLKIHKLLPISLMKSPNFALNWLFGTKSKSDKQILESILKETNSIFLKWAIDKIVNWQNITKLNNIKHIHGASDRILPIRFVEEPIEISKGGHFVTVNKAKEIVQIIEGIL